MLSRLLSKTNYLRRITGVKHEKFEKNNEAAKTRMGSVSEAEADCGPAVWHWGIARTFAAIVDVLSDVHNAFVFGANFQSG